MFETNIVVVGNVLTAPEWRRTASSQALVANFRVASTARRLDRDTGRWVDGNHLRVRVNCWRKLAEGVAASITVGDPIVVVGRLYTREWTDGDGNPRTSYEMEAVAIGHDLARGKSRFYRNRSSAVDAIAADGPEASGQVRGEAAQLVPEHEVPTSYGEGVPDGEEPTYDETPPIGLDPVAAMAGLTASAPPFASRFSGADSAEDELSPVDGGFSGDDESPDDGTAPGAGGASGDDGRSSGDDGLPARGEASDEVEALGGEPAGRRRSRRATRREPVPA